jgi:hypothetical protein
MSARPSSAAGQAGEEQRRGFGRRKSGQFGAIAIEQFEAAVGAAIGVDRHLRRAQLVDVAIDRADRDFELLRQSLGGHPAAGLQKHQNRKEAARAHFCEVGKKFLTHIDMYRGVDKRYDEGGAAGSEKRANAAAGNPPSSRPKEYRP